MFMSLTNELKPLERRVLEVIQNAGTQWLTRGQISKLLKRPGGIQPNDIAALEKLTMLGLIDSKETTQGVARVRREYRIKADE